MTLLYLAWSPQATDTLKRHADAGPVDLLVAYPVVREFEKHRRDFNVGKVFLDSGAFSVHNAGKSIDLDEYIAFARDFDCDEVAGLDVIGDAEATKRNVEKMILAGVPCIPTFHLGSDWNDLDWCCSVAPKIALGGMARKGKNRAGFINECFRRAYPKPMHGFGMTRRDIMMRFPFHSVDSSSWTFAPQKMGKWAGYTGSQIHVGARGKPSLWIEVEEHQKRAKEARFRWRREMPVLEKMMEDSDG